MRIELIQIGNSRGIRIPKLLLTQCGFDHTVNIEVESGSLVITPCKGIDMRKNWAQAFQAMHRHDDDHLLDANYDINVSDQDSWSW